MLFRRRRRSHVRTVFLGIGAMGVLLWASVYRFNVPTDVLKEYFYSTLVAMAAVVVLAGISASLLLGVRHLLRRWRGDD
ncbi:MAG: hypothetical protein ABR612_06205 [Chromatocurvus sp.]